MLALEFYLLAVVIKVVVLIGEAVDDGGENRFLFFDSFTGVFAHQRHAGVHRLFVVVCQDRIVCFPCFGYCSSPVELFSVQA